MPTRCCIPGCDAAASSKQIGEEHKPHFFHPPKESLGSWARAIPRQFTLKITHSVCSLHFHDEFLIKEDRFLINGESVSMPRLKWTLKPGAVPTIFPNLPSYLTKPSKSRKPPAQRSNLRSTSEVSKRRKPTEQESSIGNSESNTISNISMDNEVMVGSSSNGEVREILILKKKNDALKKCLALCRKKLSRSRKTVSELEVILKKYKDQHLINIAKCGKLQQEIIQTIIDKDSKTSVCGMRYPDNFLLECILFRIKSPKGYRHCKEHNLLPLPTPRSLSRLTTGLTPYPCSHCGKRFTRLSDVKRHTQQHLGVRYACDLCSKVFTSRHGLRYHLRAHKGLKPYVCEICQKAYSLQVSLLNHVNTHHNAAGTDSSAQYSLAKRNSASSPSGEQDSIEYEEGIDPVEFAEVEVMVKEEIVGEEEELVDVIGQEIEI